VNIFFKNEILQIINQFKFTSNHIGLSGKNITMKLTVNVIFAQKTNKIW